MFWKSRNTKKGLNPWVNGTVNFIDVNFNVNINVNVLVYVNVNDNGNVNSYFFQCNLLFDKNHRTCHTSCSWRRVLGIINLKYLRKILFSLKIFKTFVSFKYVINHAQIFKIKEDPKPHCMSFIWTLVWLKIF